MADTTTKIIGLISGYGAGKTYVACRKAIQLAYLNEGCDGIITEPTYPMLRDIFIPEMKKALEEWNVPYKFNSSNSIFALDINGVETKVLCMSMENVERLVGINAAWIICDEFDTTKAEIAYKAFIKLLGRLRAGSVRQFIITTTAEGFRSAYRIFVKEADSSKRLIHAKTTDNKYLPIDFIETLRAQYPENLLAAYLDGQFVNLTAGTVYSYFTRSTHSSNEIVKDGDTLLIGQDFNIDSCVSIVFVQRGENIIAVDEIISYDTKAVITNLKDRYTKHRIEIYPDASGDNRKTNASDTDIALLGQAGFSVYTNASNPSIKDRVNTVNNMFDKNRLLVNTVKCPRLTEALEQQAYDERGDPEKSNSHPANDDFNDALGYCIAYKLPILHPYGSMKMTGH